MFDYHTKPFGKFAAAATALALAFVLPFAPNLWGGTDEKEDGKIEEQAAPPVQTNSCSAVSCDPWEDPFWMPLPRGFGWDPFAEMRFMNERMNRLFSPSFASPRYAVASRASRFLPEMELSENNGAYIVRMDVPGIDKADLSVKVEGKALVVSGKRETKKKEAKEGDESKIISSNRSYGEFLRKFTLPGPFDKDAIKARCENGELVITVPKAEPPKKNEHVIEIE